MRGDQVNFPSKLNPNTKHEFSLVSQKIGFVSYSMVCPGSINPKYGGISFLPNGLLAKTKIRIKITIERKK